MQTTHYLLITTLNNKYAFKRKLLVCYVAFTTNATNEVNFSSDDMLVFLLYLPFCVVENPIDHHSIFSGDRLQEYIDIYTVPCNESPAGDMPTFTPKIINIIDPLKVTNNLGRSIHLGK